MGQLSTVLRERGFRLTLQRELILDAVESRHGHISADELYVEIHARFPQVNISTVYRTLELLEEEGLLSHTHFHDGISRWHHEEESHHQHLICERCCSSGASCWCSARRSARSSAARSRSSCCASST